MSLPGMCRTGQWADSGRIGKSQHPKDPKRGWIETCEEFVAPNLQAWILLNCTDAEENTLRITGHSHSVICNSWFVDGALSRHIRDPD